MITLGIQYRHMKLVNKFALRNYEVLEKLEAGVILTGAEAKSVRVGRAQLGQAYVKLRNNEAWLIGAHIPRYEFAHKDDLLEGRDRKLLLKKSEILRWSLKVQTKGVTIIPLSLYTKKNLIKTELALVKGISAVDKRKVLRDEDLQKDVERELRGKVPVKF